MKKILVVTVNWLGDSIMTTPVFQALKEKYPESFLAVMGPSRVQGVFLNNPFIDQFIAFDERSTHKSLWAKLKFIKMLKSKGFTSVFLIHRSFTRLLICFLAGIHQRIGFARRKNNLLLTKKVVLPKLKLHRGDLYLYLFEKSEVEVKKRLPQIFVSQHTQQRVNELFKQLKIEDKMCIGINPCANWDLKCWPREKFAALADLCVAELKAEVIFIGAEKEKPLVQRVIVLIKNSVLNLCGKTTLEELAALISNLFLFVSNDSGPAHMSAALGVPTVVLFGPTSQELTAPRGEKVFIVKEKVSCDIPCYKKECADNVCMQNITVEQVFAVIKEIWEKQQQERYVRKE